MLELAEDECYHKLTCIRSGKQKEIENDMKKVTVLVAAHKKFEPFQIEGYMPIQVGAKGKQSLGFVRDDSGENISEKNPQYCELTAHYWAWKNMDSDIVGLVHYRRYFVEKPYDKNPKSQIPDANRLRELMNDYRIILPKPVHKLENNGTLYKNRPREQQNAHLLLLEDIMKEMAPEYMPSFEKIVYGREASFGNMLVSEKELFDAYSAWMFPILEEFERRGTEQNIMIPRLCGFMSEYLLCVWVDHNIPADKVRYMEVWNTEEDTSKPVYRVRRLLVKSGIFEPVSKIAYKIYDKVKGC